MILAESIQVTSLVCSISRLVLGRNFLERIYKNIEDDEINHAFCTFFIGELFEYFSSTTSFLYCLVSCPPKLILRKSVKVYAVFFMLVLFSSCLLPCMV